MFLEELIRKFRENPKVIMEELEVQTALHSNSSAVINSSEFYMLILIVSRYNKNTSWARNLLGAAKKQASNDPHKIIPVLIDESSLIRSLLPERQSGFLTRMIIH